MSVAVIAASAFSPAGSSWRGLLEASGLAGEVPPVRPEVEASFARSKKLMSRAAYLAALAAQDAVLQAGWDEGREEIGCWLGVGASGGSMPDLTAMLAPSIVDGVFSLRRFAGAGVAAASPLLAFQLMGNFTLCHAAITLGLGGPNSAFFSRGGGTVTALAEAIHALAEGECERVLAGGADSALHPVTLAELRRDGIAGGASPSEGAALLALAPAPPDERPPLAWVESCFLASLRHRGCPEVRAQIEDAFPDVAVDLVVTALSAPHRRLLGEMAAAKWPGARHVHLVAGLGESLAAAPALGWAAALDGIAGGAERAVVVSSGLDRQLGVVAFTREGAR